MDKRKPQPSRRHRGGAPADRVGIGAGRPIAGRSIAHIGHQGHGPGRRHDRHCGRRSERQTAAQRCPWQPGAPGRLAELLRVDPGPAPLPSRRVETSTNLGIVVLNDGQLEVKCLARSSVDTAVGDVTQMIASVWDLAGMKAELSGSYGGWRPAPNSPILGLMQEVHRELYGQEAQVRAIHAGLECGTIGGKVPGLDMISIGPTLEDVHTPSERLKIASVQKVMDLLVETLRRVPDKWRYGLVGAPDRAQDGRHSPIGR
jgi:hypothetical protein